MNDTDADTDTSTDTSTDTNADTGTNADNTPTLGLTNPDVVRAIEAIVMVSAEPVEPGALATLLDVTAETVDDLCDRLARAYDEAGAGFQLVKVAGGWRYQSHPDLAPYVERHVLEGQTARLSAAALESLAIVAYKQPISRAQIASIRGVDPDAVLRTLQARGYVDQIGRDPGPGQAMLWGTTTLFLEKLGLASLADLPALAEFVPGADVVEALEQGLRVTPPAAPVPAETGPTGAEAEPTGAEVEAGPIVDELVVPGASADEPARPPDATGPVEG